MVYYVAGEDGLVMNIIASFAISILFSLINNSILLADLIKKSANLNLEIDFNINNNKFKKTLIKEIMLLLIPIINLLNSLELDVLYMTNENSFINILKEEGILKNMSDWESQNIKKYSSFIEIIYNQLKYKSMLSKSSKLNLDKDGEIIYTKNKKGITILKSSGLLHNYSIDRLKQIVEGNLEDIIRDDDTKKYEKRIIFPNYPLTNITNIDFHRNLKLIRRKHN